jgi:hypothetical protein
MCAYIFNNIFLCLSMGSIFENWTETDIQNNEEYFIGHMKNQGEKNIEDVKSKISQFSEIYNENFVPFPVTPSEFPTFYTFLSTNPTLEQIIEFIQTSPEVNFENIIEIFIYINKSVLIQRRNGVPLIIDTKWVENESIVEKCYDERIGFCFGGGGQAAQAIATGLITGLYDAGVLSKDYIDYMCFVSGSVWCGVPLSFEKYSTTGQKVSDNFLDTLLTTYIPPENLKIDDLLFQKDEKKIINNAGQFILFTLKLLLYFLQNLFDPEVPLKFVLSNTFGQGQLEQFGLYSTKSILQKTQADVDRVFGVNPVIKENIDSYFLLRPNFPEVITTINGAYPNISGNGSYNFFQLNMNSLSYGAIANDATVSDPNDGSNTIHIGQRIENFAFGNEVVNTLAYPNIQCEVPSASYLASINQMTGLAADAFALPVNSSANPFINFLKSEYIVNSYLNVSNQKAFLSDGGQYDNSGDLSLLSNKIATRIFSVISAGEVIDKVNGIYPKQLTDPFALTTGTAKRNLEAVLNPADFDSTVDGILSSPDGVFTKTYTTLSSVINGSEPYEVTITWIYINIEQWYNRLSNNVKLFVNFIPSFPFNGSIINRVNLLPATANAYNYFFAYIGKEVIAPLLNERINKCIEPPKPPFKCRKLNVIDYYELPESDDDKKC